MNMGQIELEKSVLVRSQILGLFFNALTSEYQDSHRNMQNFPQEIQTQLSQKRKAFPGFFIEFLKCASSLQHFEKKDDTSSLSILEIIDSKRGGYLNV